MIVVVADDPPPSVAAQLDWSVVSGLAIDAGSRTSHTAILARSLGIPTIVGLRTATSMVMIMKKLWRPQPSPTVNMWCAHTSIETNAIPTDENATAL